MTLFRNSATACRTGVTALFIQSFFLLQAYVNLAAKEPGAPLSEKLSDGINPPENGTG
jgi:hypothetical protein